MYCNECGALNPDGAKFCNACGSQLHATIKPVERKEKDSFYKTYDELAKFGAAAPKEDVEKAEEPVSAVVEPVPEETPVSEEATLVKQEENPLAKLSTFSQKPSVKEEKRVASPYLNPIEDDYWDDTLKEIETEIYAIPKENIIKIAGSILALLAVIAWFIYML